MLAGLKGKHLGKGVVGEGGGGYNTQAQLSCRLARLSVKRYINDAPQAQQTNSIAILIW